MKKRDCLFAQIILLIWFFLDMTGLYIGAACLVTRSYKEDMVYFVIYLATVLVFVVKEKIGRWAVIIWTTMWLVIQLLCHEWYTIFQGGVMGSLEGKIEYFSETIQWMKIEGRYIPDVYHSILHILILVVLVSTIRYTMADRKK